MNIAILAHLHYPIAQPYVGGLESHTAHLAYELQRQGHQVTLYAAKGSDKNLNTVSIFEGDALGGNNTMIELAYHWAVNQIKAADYDFVINNTLNPVPVQLLSKTNIPTLTIFHTPPLPKLVKAIKQIDLTGAPDTLRYAAVSSLTAGQWKQATGMFVETIYNGIAIGNTKLPNVQERVGSGYLVWSGRITPEKGTHIAIRAAHLAGMPLKLIGSIYDKTYFNNVVQPLLACTRTQYLGHVDQRTIRKVYQDASVALVTPLWDEPFGLVIVEALLSGTPVAALPNGAVAEILSPKTGHIADNSTPEALAKAITIARTKNPRYCVELVRSKYSLDRMARDYVSLMHPLLASGQKKQKIWMPVPA
jgi:glycosyltransferase involved in cell wall biosynthesis